MRYFIFTLFKKEIHFSLSPYLFKISENSETTNFQAKKTIFLRIKVSVSCDFMIYSA